MARALRILFEGAWYHVMNRGINHGSLFFNDHHRKKFLGLLNEIKTIYGVEIHAYCLMTNHYHLILHTPRGNLNHAMKYLNSSYAANVNKTMERDGPLFKGRYLAKLISIDDYLIQLSRYIHLNPLEAKLVDSLSDYQWSSYRNYLGISNANPWLTTEEIKNRFGINNFNYLYKKYVESDEPNHPKRKINENNLPVIGGEEFCQMIDEYVKKYRLSNEIVGSNRILVPPSIELIISTVAKYFGVGVQSISNQATYTKNPGRRIAIYICRKISGKSLIEIGSAMGDITYKSVSTAVQRVQSDITQMEIANELIKNLLGCARTIKDSNLVR